MKKSTIRSYTFEIWPSAIDEFGINQKFSDHVETKYDNNDISHKGELILTVTTSAESPRKALFKSISHLDELFDYYCTLKGIPISVEGYDQIDLISPKLPLSKHPRYGTIFAQPFSISKKEVGLVYSHILKLRESKFGFLNLAMKYYRKAKLAEETDDKVIYYFIALESLFSDQGTEITLRFSQRISLLLGKTILQRKKIIEICKKMYKKRSQIVHGTKTIVDKKDITRVDHLVQKSIQAFMELINHYKDHDEILTNLDQCVIDEKTRIKLQKQSKFSLNS